MDVDGANRSGRRPVVFIHGLWLPAASWAPWLELFGAAGYAPLALDWPGEAASVEEARAHPELVASLTIRSVLAALDATVERLGTKPAIVGHSFGGLFAEMLAGGGRAAATVAIDPAPFRGVLPVPLSALRAASPVLRNAANRRRGVPLNFGQFRYAFANAVPEPEARDLFDRWAVPAPGGLVFEDALCNVNPWTAARADTRNPSRGPLLILDGELDRTVPWSLAKDAHRLQRRNPGLTDLAKVAGRGHSLTIDSGWREVAELALAFVRRHVPPTM